MKKLNNNGFTLVELLATVALLSVISTIVIGGFSATLTKIDDQELTSKKELIYSATDLYLSNHPNLRSTFQKGSCTINISSLVEEGLIEKKDTKDSQNSPLGPYITYQEEYILTDNPGTLCE